MPAHGTVPAALTAVHWEDWAAATRLAVREARRLIGADKPLHLIGYSNGAALALEYLLAATDDPTLAKPERLVLISPMVGLSRYARYAGIAGWPAILPAFAKAAWLDIVPEFNPFKYNSFPVNGARQSYALTQVVSERFAAAVASGAIERLPPILAFQSVVDSTISARAVFSGLFAHLPANGSEIVLFDVNRASTLETLLTTSSRALAEHMIPAGVQKYRITVLGNSSGTDEVSERSVSALTTRAEVRALGLSYPRDLFSLSHIALPFPPTDSLYGTDPEGEDFGVHLGAQALRGERGTLIVGADTLWRASCNPFFSYVAGRIEEVITASTGVPANLPDR
jgi:alpha-beta hydrolase superfamily lysophospholipase